MRLSPKNVYWLNKTNTETTSIHTIIFAQMSSPNLEFSDSDSPLEAYEKEQSLVRDNLMESALQGMFELNGRVLLLKKDNKTFLLDTSTIVDENIGITIGSLKKYCHAKGYQNADPAAAPLVEKETRAPTRKRANTSAPRRRVQTPATQKRRKKYSKCSCIFTIGEKEFSPAELYNFLFPNVELFNGKRSDTPKYLRYLLSGTENAFSAEELGQSESTMLSVRINYDCAVAGCKVKVIDHRMEGQKVQDIQQALLKHVKDEKISLSDVCAMYEQAKTGLDKWKRNREENAKKKRRKNQQQEE